MNCLTSGPPRCIVLPDRPAGPRFGRRADWTGPPTCHILRVGGLTSMTYQVTADARHSRRAVLGSTAAMTGVVGVAACGQSDGAPTQSAAKGKTLFWQWGAGYVDGFTSLVKEFNDKNTGVTVDFDSSAVTAGTSDYWVKLTAAMAGNVGPDVFLMNTNARTWATNGQMRAIDDLIKKDKTAQDQNNATLKAFKEWYDVGGKQMGWAWDYSTIVTYYNVGHLREAALKLPSEMGDKWD